MIDKNLLNVIYYTTYRCNLNCDYCFNKKRREETNYEPTIQDTDNLIKNISKYKIGTFLCYGGEPTIAENFLYLIHKIESDTNYDEIKITTNCTRSDISKLLYTTCNYNKIYNYCTIHPKVLSKDLLSNIMYMKEHFYKFKLSIILDKRYESNIMNFYDFWKEHFSFEDTFFQVVRKNNESWYKRFGLDESEFSDFKFLKRVADKFQFRIKDLIEFKRTPPEFIGKLCCNNFLRINSNGYLTDYQGSCFPNSTETRNIFHCENYEYNFPVVKCENSFQPYRMCEYCTHED